MKLLSLNLWGGRIKDKLFAYLKQESEGVDIFCFQEVFNSQSDVSDYHGARPRLLGELKNLLPEFEGYYRPTYSGWIDKDKVDFTVSEGQAIYVRKDYKISESGRVYIYGNEQTQIREDFTNEPKDLIFVKITAGSKELLVVNPHGKWHPGGKLDTPERIEQSGLILDFTKQHNCPKIISGDFNLMPDTKSISLLEKDFRNLIKEFKIKNTRNKISWDHYGNIQHFADYAFVSPEVQVKSFEVPYNEVSDHLPMILDFTI